MDMSVQALLEQAYDFLAEADQAKNKKRKRKDLIKRAGIRLGIGAGAGVASKAFLRAADNSVIKIMRPIMKTGGKERNLHGVVFNRYGGTAPSYSALVNKVAVPMGVKGRLTPMQRFVLGHELGHRKQFTNIRDLLKKLGVDDSPGSVSFETMPTHIKATLKHYFGTDTPVGGKASLAASAATSLPSRFRQLGVISGTLGAALSKDPEQAKIAAIIGSLATVPSLRQEYAATARSIAHQYKRRGLGGFVGKQAGFTRGIAGNVLSYGSRTAVPLVTYAWRRAIEKEIAKRRLTPLQKKAIRDQLKAGSTPQEIAAKYDLHLGYARKLGKELSESPKPVRFLKGRFHSVVKEPINRTALALRHLKGGRLRIRHGTRREQRVHALRAHLHAKGRMTPRRKELLNNALRKAISKKAHGYTMIRRAKKSLKTRVPQLVGPGSVAISVPGGSEIGTLSSLAIRHGVRKVPSKLRQAWRDA